MVYPISPFLELDEERRKRDQLLQQQVSNVGSSLVAAPLTYEKLMKDAEDRRLKLEADRIKLKQTAETHESNLQNDTVNRDNVGQDNTREDGKIKEEKFHNAAKSVAVAGVGENLSDQDILMKTEGHPDLKGAGDRWQDVQAEITNARNQAEKDKNLLALKKMDAETRLKRANAVGRAKSSSVKIEKLPVGMRDQLVKIKQGQNVVAEIANKKRAVDTGLVNTFVATVKQMLKMPEQDRAVFDQEIQRLFNQIVKDQSGATVTAQEMSRQLQAFPDKWNEDGIFNAALEAYAQDLEDKEQVLMDTLGSEPAFAETVRIMRDNEKPLPAVERGKGSNEPVSKPKGPNSPKDGESPMQFKTRMEAAGLKDEEIKQLWLTR